MCPQASQSPVLQELIAGIPKTHVSVILPQTKPWDLRCCGDMYCVITMLHWRGQTWLSLFLTLLDVVGIWIFLKCFLVRAILLLSPCYNPSHTVVNSLPLLLFLPCYTFLTYFKLLYRVPATGPSWIKYHTTKTNPLKLHFEAEDHVVPYVQC